MVRKIKVRKASGEAQDFSEEKLRGSLLRSGASEKLADAVLEEMHKYLREEISTREIYRKAFLLLRKRVKSNAARYSLKKAIMELGPSGFPFEQLVGAILKHQGYKVEVGCKVQGKCVQHEVDVVADKQNHIIMVECKYHNTQGKICSVQVPLYINSRFNDIDENRRLGNDQRPFHGWVVTNTRFSEDALEYGNCAGLKLIGWDYPRKGSLKEMIEEAGLFPVTVVTGLNTKQKQKLLDKGILLCNDLCVNPGILDQLDLDQKRQQKIMDEVNDLCLL